MSLLVRHPLTMITADEAVSSTFQFNRVTGKIRGAVYDQMGNRINVGIRIGGNGGDVIVNDDPDTLPEMHLGARRLRGTTVYLGNLMAQYGHFITEGMSNYWLFEHLDRSFDRIFFHPFLFGDSIKPFMEPFHQSLGLNGVEVVISREACRFERVLIPERTIVLNKSAHVQHRRTIARALDSITLSARSTPSRLIFLSRSKLEGDGRAIVNGLQMDEAAERLGFAVIHPQQLTVETQLSLYRDAIVIAGLSGSALHNCLFQKPGAHLIEISVPRLPHKPHPMQVICNELAQVHGHHIPLSQSGPREWDIDKLQSALSRLLP